MDSTATTSKRPCFIEVKDGLASLVDMEAGFSGDHQHQHHQQRFVSRPLCYSVGRSSFFGMSIASVSSLRSGRVCDAKYEEPRPHFLDACFLCKKPLGDNRDIFMYRGNNPFCSEECRQEQIDMDEANEKSRNISASMKASRKKDQKKSTSPNKSTQDYRFRTSTVAAA